MDKVPADEKWVTLCTFATLGEALLARAKLESEGIPAMVPGETSLSIRAYHGPTEVLLQVPESRRHDARNSLDLDTPAAQAELECPQCGALSPRPLKRNLLAYWLTALFTAPYRPATKYSCLACGSVWKSSRSPGRTPSRN